MLASEQLIEFLETSFENELAAPGHRVPRIQCEIHHDLIKLAGVSLDNRIWGARLHDNLYVITHQRMNKFCDFFETLVQVENLDFRRLLAAEG